MEGARLPGFGLGSLIRSLRRRRSGRRAVMLCWRNRELRWDGRRHRYGLAELQAAGWHEFELVAVADPVRDNAESLANLASERLGHRPAVVTDLDQLPALDVEAVDVTTTPRSHHTIAVDALARGFHALVEKPPGLTVRACSRIRTAAAQSGPALSVAENYRRDPINHLAYRVTVEFAKRDGSR